MEAILAVLIAAIPGVLLTRMPARPERQPSDRYARQMLLASPMLAQGGVAFLFLVFYPDGVFWGLGLAWMIAMGICWWLPTRLKQKKKRSAQHLPR
ncbi:MAG: hypothetical protein JNM76_03445 [Betaproteobacteria bacterium]|nr:hypothetical protein [Betaproteobacteria bacterium]